MTGTPLENIFTILFVLFFGHIIVSKMKGEKAPDAGVLIGWIIKIPLLIVGNIFKFIFGSFFRSSTKK